LKTAFLLMGLFLSAGSIAQTYNTYQQGGNNNSGGNYVAPVVTKTYTMPSSGSTYTPASSYTSPTQSSTYTPTYSSPAVISKRDPDEYDPYAALSSPDVTKSSAYCRTHADSVYWWGEAETTRMGKAGYTTSNYYSNTNTGYTPSYSGDISYEKVDEYIEGTARVKNNGQYGFIDLQGTAVVPLEYDYASEFYYDYDLTMVFKNDIGYGYVNRKGEVVVPLQYHMAADHFEEGLAAVALNGKYGYINEKGEVVIPFMYDRADRFHYGEAKVQLNDEKIIIDKNGNRVE
jgi:hypothetical protein